MARRALSQHDDPIDQFNLKPGTTLYQAGDVGDYMFTVRVGALATEGELVELRGSRALVISRGKRMWVATDELRATAASGDAAAIASRYAEIAKSVRHRMWSLGLVAESNVAVAGAAAVVSGSELHSRVL